MDKVVPNNLIIILDAWFNVGLQGNKKKIWCSLFFMVVWSLWRYRNEIIFHNKIANEEEFIQELKHRWSCWCMEKGYVNAPYPNRVFS